MVLDLVADRAKGELILLHAYHVPVEYSAYGALPTSWSFFDRGATEFAKTELEKWASRPLVVGLEGDDRDRRGDAGFGHRAPRQRARRRPGRDGNARPQRPQGVHAGLGGQAGRAARALPGADGSPSGLADRGSRSRPEGISGAGCYARYRTSSLDLRGDLSLLIDVTAAFGERQPPDRHLATAVGGHLGPPVNEFLHFRCWEIAAGAFGSSRGEVARAGYAERGGHRAVALALAPHDSSSNGSDRASRRGPAPGRLERWWVGLSAGTGVLPGSGRRA